MILSREKDNYERKTRKFTTKSRKQPIEALSRLNQLHNTTAFVYSASTQNRCMVRV